MRTNQIWALLPCAFFAYSMFKIGTFKVRRRLLQLIKKFFLTTENMLCVDICCANLHKFQLFLFCSLCRWLFTDAQMCLSCPFSNSQKKKRTKKSFVRERQAGLKLNRIWNLMNFSQHNKKDKKKLPATSTKTRFLLGKYLLGGGREKI